MDATTAQCPAWRAQRGLPLRPDRPRRPGRFAAACLTTILALLLAEPAAAHPHILIDARSEILFNGHGQVTGIANVWDFDDAFSAYAVQGYDSKDDGNPTRADLQPLAEINLQSLAEYNYFTKLKVGGTAVKFAKPKDYYDVFENERLTLHFTLPLVDPLDVHGRPFELDVYDPDYFAAITFVQDKPVHLVGATPGCDTMVHRPDALDPAVAGRLAVIPADQRSLPPELFAVTDKLVNAVTMACR